MKEMFLNYFFKIYFYLSQWLWIDAHFVKSSSWNAGATSVGSEANAGASSVR